MKTASFDVAILSFFYRYGLCFPGTKISPEWDRLQSFLNICCNFGKKCHINVIRFLFCAKYGSLTTQNMQQISLGGFFEWETAVYFCPLFVHFKTLLTTLTNSAMLLCQIVDRGLTESQLIMMVIFDATFEDDTVASEWIKAIGKVRKRHRGLVQRNTIFNLDKSI